MRCPPVTTPARGQSVDIAGHHLELDLTVEGTEVDVGQVGRAHHLCLGTRREGIHELRVDARAAITRVAAVQSWPALST